MNSINSDRNSDRKSGLSDGLFDRWFVNYATQNMLIKLICTLSILSIEIIELLTSKLFGLPMFMAPFTMKTMQYLNTNMIWTVLLENIPQIGIQIFVLFINHEDIFAPLTVANLMVSVIDVLSVVINAAMWKAYH